MFTTVYSMPKRPKLHPPSDALRRLSRLALHRNKNRRPNFQCSTKHSRKSKEADLYGRCELTAQSDNDLARPYVI